MDLFIRLYREQDQEVIYRIGADTAFFGEPVEAFLDDRRLFCDAFYRYYIDYELEHIWVACAEAQVVGFLAGCLDTKTRSRIWISRLLPWVVWRTVRGTYRLGPRTRHYARRLRLEAWNGNIPRPDLRAFPAHLHLNIAEGWRGRGLGRRLLTAYLNDLRRSSVPGVHLETTSRNVAACRLYEALGFHLLDERPSSLWTRLVNEPVANRCYGLDFGRA